MQKRRSEHFGHNVFQTFFRILLAKEMRPAWIPVAEHLPFQGSKHLSTSLVQYPGRKMIAYGLAEWRVIQCIFVADDHCERQCPAPSSARSARAAACPA